MRQQGFTLVELVVTIALLSIVATISSKFVQQSAQGLLDTSGRQQMASASYVVNEKISRALRNALPGSIRVTSDESCIEYIPTLAASMYTELPLGSDISLFKGYPYSSSTSVNGYVAVYSIAADNPYSLSNPGPISTQKGDLPAGAGEVNISLSAPHTFELDSPERRFYMLSDPEAICQQGSYLYRYSGYGFVSDLTSLQASLPADFANGREVLAFPLQAGSMSFRYLSSTLQRNSLIVFEYILQHPVTGEQQEISQQVRMFNVP